MFSQLPELPDVKAFTQQVNELGDVIAEVNETLMIDNSERKADGSYKLSFLTENQRTGKTFFNHYAGYAASLCNYLDTPDSYLEDLKRVANNVKEMAELFKELKVVKEKYQSKTELITSVLDGLKKILQYATQKLDPKKPGGSGSAESLNGSAAGRQDAPPSDRNQSAAVRPF